MVKTEDAARAAGKAAVRAGAGDQLSRAERVARGKDARAAAPLESHAEFTPDKSRDPVGLLLGQAESRVPELVPVELVEPGVPRGASAIYDANRFLLLGLLEGLGAEVTDLGILADEPALLAESIAQAARTHDLVLTSGGVSTGEADHVRTAIETPGHGLCANGTSTSEKISPCGPALRTFS